MLPIGSPLHATSTGGPEVQEFLNVVPPGQRGRITMSEINTHCPGGLADFPDCSGPLPDHHADQMHMYESLVFDTSIQSDTELLEYYKDAPIHLPAERAETIRSPIDGVTIKRGRFGIPHIEGRTRHATMYGIGYATARDRLWLMDILRHLGRAKLASFLPAIPSVVNRDRDQLEVAPYRESDLTEQVRRGCSGTEEQREVCRDARAYIDGINQFVEEAQNDSSVRPVQYDIGLGVSPEKFKMEDVVAISSLVTGIFGTGGSNELGNNRFLNALRQNFNDTRAERLWEDFNAEHDPEYVTVLEKPFPYNDHTNIDTSSTALLDPGSIQDQLQPVSTSTTTTGGTTRTITAESTVSPGELSPAARRITKRIADGLKKLYDGEASMSNALVVGGSNTRSGHPVAVFGPQTSYFLPQLLVEMAVEGPGIKSRGAAFAGVNMYVQLGRGTDYAWSATSSGADIEDQWAMKLCEPDGSAPTLDSTHYVYNGECRAMDVYEKHTGAETFVIQMTEHGFVTHRGTVDGRPVAVTKQRSTFNRETESALGFKRINNPQFMTSGAESFQEAMEGVEATFNWFYVDSQDIAYKHSCRCPIRDARTDPRLPTWGTGEWDWTGRFLDPRNNPHSVNPDQGYLVDWNGKQAPKFGAGGMTAHRSQLLENPLLERVNAPSNLTRSDAVEVMIDGGTRDLKPQELFPFLLRILEPGTAPTARLADMRARLADWVASGGHRRDVDPVDAPVDTDPLTPDTSATYDHGVAVQIGDAALEHLVRGTFGDTIAGLIGTGEDSPRGGQGSAFQSGPYGHLEKDWRMVLGDPVANPTSKFYCGDGDMATCRQALWDALAQTASDLETRFGSAAVADWEYDAERDNITQTAFLTIELPNMQWVNRPTFQQVAQPGGSPVKGTEGSGSGSGGGCLVERTLPVPGLHETLRTYRDTLLGTPAGRFVTRSYYRLSERFAD